MISHAGILKHPKNGKGIEDSVVIKGGVHQQCSTDDFIPDITNGITKAELGKELMVAGK